MIIASLIILLSGQSAGVVETSRCLANITALQESIAPLIRVYQEALDTLTLSELHQLKTNPLQVPKPEKLTSFSAAFPILEKIIPHLRAHKLPGLGQELQLMISYEIESKQNVSTAQMIEVKKTEHLKSHFSILGSFGWVDKIIANPNGEIIYSHSKTGVQFWNAKTGAPLRNKTGRQIELNVNERTEMNVHPAGDIFYTGEHGANLVYWNAHTGEPLLNKAGEQITLQRKTGDKGILGISPDGNILYYGTYYGEIHFWNARTGEPVLNQHEEPIVILSNARPDRIRKRQDYTRIAVSKDSSLLYSLTSEDGRIRIWNAKTGEAIFERNLLFMKKQKIFSNARNAAINILLPPTADRIYSVCTDIIQAWDINTRIEINLDPIHIEHAGFYPKTLLATNAPTRDGKYLFFVHPHGSVQVINLMTGKVHEMNRQPPNLKAVATSSDGDFIYTGCHNRIERWYMPDHAPKELLEELQ